MHHIGRLHLRVSIPNLSKIGAQNILKEIILKVR